MAVSKVVQPSPRFTATPDSIARDAESLVRHLRRLQDDLVQTVPPSAATFASVMVPLAHIESEFSVKGNILGFFRSVSEDDQIRVASMNAETLLDDFRTESRMRDDIFALVSAVRDHGEDLDQESSLLLKSVYDKHIQTGVGLGDATQRQRFKEIRTRLSQIETNFDENLATDKNTTSFTSAELRGVPSHVLERLGRNEAQDQYEVIPSNPDHMEILSYAREGETRKRLFMAGQNVCGGNRPLLKEAVLLRHEAALLLGFPDNATYQLQRKMAKNPDTVNEFLADIRFKITPPALESLQAFKDFKKNDLKSHGEADQYEDQFFL